MNQIYQEQLQNIAQELDINAKQKNALEQKLYKAIFDIQEEKHQKSLKVKNLEYYSYYSGDTSPVIAVKTTKDNWGIYCLEIRADNGNGPDFFYPFDDGKIDLEELTQSILALK